MAGLSLVVLVAGALAPVAATAGPPAPSGVARQALDLFLQGKPEELRLRFAASVRDEVTMAQLQAAAQAIAAQLGDLLEAGEPQLATVPAGTQVAIPLRFEKGSIGLYVTVTGAGELLGFVFGPPPSASPEAQAGEPTPGGREEAQGGDEYTSPAYVDPSSFEERTVTVGKAPGLPGTLSVPKGVASYPAVVLVHGSGPSDRDETVGAVKPFRDLAEGLASRGIAVLRYDKRTYRLAHDPGFRQEAGLQASDVTPDVETIDDAVAAAEWLRRQPGVQHVVVIGHSLGGMLAPEIARRAGASVAGAVVLAGSTRPIETLIVEQLEYLAGLDGTVAPEEQAQIDQVKDVAGALQTRSLPPDAPVLGVPAGYFYALRELLPVPIARQLAIPMLIVSGGRDYQVPAADFEGWRDGLRERTGVTFRRYASINHLLVPGEGPSSPDEYVRPGHVAEEVVGDIAAWIREIAG